MQKWVDSAIFYQVYPATFYDANGDGIGDLKGIEEKVGYIKKLGVTAVWINPFFKSPFMDGGYDVQDFYSVDERFGTMQNFESLVSAFKRAGIRVLIDLVIGHTSDKHEWFLNSAKDGKNEYSDYYIWTDSIFNKYEDKTIHGLYPRDGGYYVNYYACQPALNFGFNESGKTGLNKDNDYDLGDGWKIHYTDERLKPLRDEIIKIMEFWLDKGIDGFRVDMANSLVKGCRYNAENDKEIEGLIWLWDKLLTPIRKKYPEVAFIAEWCYPKNAVAKCGFDLDYFGHDNSAYNDLFRNEKETNLLPSFEKGHNYFSSDGKGTVKNFIEHTLKLHEELGDKGGFSAPTGCHDSIRMSEKTEPAEQKLIFAFLLTYKQIPMIYYGDEIGMTHRFGINKDGGYIRTGARTPMQWNDGKNRGFSEAEEIYLPVNDDKAQSVSAQENDENSVLNLVRKLIDLRKKHRAFDYTASVKITECENGYPLVYEREKDGEKITVYINPSKEVIRRKYTGNILPNGKCNILLKQNAEADGEYLTLGAASFAIVLSEL